MVISCHSMVCFWKNIWLVTNPRPKCSVASVYRMCTGRIQSGIGWWHTGIHTNTAHCPPGVYTGVHWWHTVIHSTLYTLRGPGGVWSSILTYLQSYLIIWVSINKTIPKTIHFLKPWLYWKTLPVQFFQSNQGLIKCMVLVLFYW